MQHLKFDLGFVQGGTTVVVQLDKQANVHLLDRNNYDRYQRGLDYRAHGGVQVRSPAHLEVPSPGFWYVAIDLGGNAGTVQASVSTRSAA
jgi:hypothetical protein